MKRAVKKALSVMLTISLVGAGSSMSFTSFAAETEVMLDAAADSSQDTQLAAEPEQENTQSGEEAVIQPRTEQEAGGGEGAGGSTGGESGGSTGGESGGSTGGDTGSTESGGNTGGDTGSTESGGSTGGDTGSTESGGSTGGDTGSTESGGSTGGDTGSTEKEPETEKKPDKETNKETNKETEKETEKKPNKETEKETEKKPNKETEKETEKKPNKETEKETQKETQKETEKQQQSTQAPVVVTKPNTQTVATEQTEAETQAPEENLLYSEYLGTGEGWSQLKIVADENSAAEDYEMLVLQNAVIVCTQSDPIQIQDETQPDEMRSLVLSGDQLARLFNEREAEYLVFEVDQAMITAQIQEFLSGNTAKLIDLALSGETVTEETLQLDFDSMAEAELSEEQLASVSFEIRVTIYAQEDGSSAYGISVWMLWADQKLEVSKMLPALNVAMDVAGMFAEEEKTDFAMNHAVEWMDESGMVVWRASALVDMPEALVGGAEGPADRFTVQMQDGMEIPDTAYAEEESLDSHSHSVLMAVFAGPGTYGIS